MIGDPTDATRLRNICDRQDNDLRDLTLVDEEHDQEIADLKDRITQVERRQSTDLEAATHTLEAILTRIARDILHEIRTQ